MNKEQKAQAYDKALEIARQYYEKGSMNAFLDTIFSELAESEDERIRKFLVGFFASYKIGDVATKLNGVRIDDILAYLEKQKEPDYLNKFTKLPHLNSDYEVVDDWAYTPSLCHCDGNWTVCWIHCEDGDVLHECIGDTPVEAIDKAVEWFTSLNKQIPVKKVGAIISSRDKEETACGYLERCLTPDMRKVWYEACDELKKACFQEAEKQKEQKPAEWSEEDEKDMAHIIRILDDCYVYGTHDLSKTDRENLVNKLKSLRPHWKPSEEHLEALLNTLHPDDPYYSDLKSLYEQLKKLT